jgi:tetratricopeptide (TPR) repeat protein
MNVRDDEPISALAPDCKGAQMLVEQAGQLASAGKDSQAWNKCLEAVAIFEKVAPDSNELADLYIALSMNCFFEKAPPENRLRRALSMICSFASEHRENRLRRQQEGLAWYEKGIAIYDRTGNAKELSGHLTNISVMYARIGDRAKALDRAKRGLALARILNDQGDADLIAAWTQTTGHLLALGLLDEAKEIIDEGLRRFSEDPLRAYLLKADAQFHTETAKLCLALAKELLPEGACPI